LKKDRSFLEEDRKNIKEVIINVITEAIEQILKQANKDLKDIDLIGVGFPR